MVPVAPESYGRYGGIQAKKRKRLAKAFSRPLDKKLKDARAIRVKLSVRADEQAQLLGLQLRLAGQGVRARKGELLRAGLRLLATLDDADFQAALARAPAKD
jgi:hypothetical protein